VPTVETLILGAGLAGLSTKWFLASESAILDKGDRPGGLAITYEESGYRFDITGHWLHMRDDGVKESFGTLLDMDSVIRKSQIFTHKRLIPYPFQSNLKMLPEDVKIRCVMDAVEAHVRREKGEPEPTSFGDFVLYHFGEGIAHEFMFPYNEKLWGVEPNEISHDWTQRFVPVPNLRQIVEGAFTDKHLKAGYNATFSYPPQGGIERFSAAIASKLDGIHLNTEVVRIHPTERWVETASGERWNYKNLVNTFPLKAFVELLVDAPNNVHTAGDKLRSTSLDYLDLGLKGEALQGLHWVYLPQKHLPAYRIGCFSNACPGMAPEGCSSLYVELSNAVKWSFDDALNQTLDALNAIGPSNVSREDVEVCRKRHVDFAYVIYDHAYQKARSTVFEYLSDQNISSIGRYGKWVYASMEDALIDGRETAARLMEEFHGE